MKVVLVTGAAGFVGASLVRHLLERGRSVRVLDDLSSGRQEYLADLLEEVDATWATISDLEAVRRAAQGAESIVHLAARSGIGPSIEAPDLDFEVNVAGTFNVLDAARREGVRRVVVASSGAVLAGADPPLDEGVLPCPQSPYGASKLCAEAMLQGFEHAFGIAGVVLRFSNVYGPYCLHKASVVPQFIRRSLDGEPLVIHGDGSQTRDFVYVGDIVRAIDAALDRDQGGVYQLGTGVETSVVELARMIAELSGAGSEVEHLPARPGDARRNFVDASRAAAELAWTPEIDLGQGLTETLEWLRTRVGGP